MASNTRITALDTTSYAIRSISSDISNNMNVAKVDFSTIVSGSKFDEIRTFNNTGIEKFTNPVFENFSKGFSNNEPQLLFVAEYIVNGTNFGTLVVWENFMNASHYELFKRNVFQSDAKFERILFLDAASLREETSNYIDYLKNTIGLDINADSVFVILDTSVKKDRIYEYKILASKVPQNVYEVSYGFILKSKNLTKDVVVDSNSTSTLFDFSGFVLGSKELAWTIAILNDAVPFFGRNSIKNSLVSLELEKDEDGNEFVIVATDLNNILNIINESVSLFGLKDTYIFLVKSLGGLSADFIQAFSDSVDESNKTFSYDSFKSIIQKRIPAFNLVLQIAQSNNAVAIDSLSKLSITLPTQFGTETFASIESITKIFNFVNNTFISALYSQDNAKEVQTILDVSLQNPVVAPLADAATTVVTSVPGVPANAAPTISNALTDIINKGLGTSSAPTSNLTPDQVSTITTKATDTLSTLGINITPSPATTETTTSLTVQATNLLSRLGINTTMRTL